MIIVKCKNHRKGSVKSLDSTRARTIYPYLQPHSIKKSTCGKMTEHLNESQSLKGLQNLLSISRDSNVRVTGLETICMDSRSRFVLPIACFVLACLQATRRKRREKQQQKRQRNKQYATTNQSSEIISSTTHPHSFLWNRIVYKLASMLTETNKTFFLFLTLFW